MAIDPSDTKLDSRRDQYRRSEELARLSRDGRSTGLGQSSDVRGPPPSEQSSTRDRTNAQDQARAQEQRIDQLTRMTVSGTTADGRSLTAPQLAAAHAELKVLQTRDVYEARRAVLQTTVPTLEASYNRAKGRFDKAQTGGDPSEKEDAKRALDTAQRERDVGRLDFKTHADRFRQAGAEGKWSAAKNELAALDAKPQLTDAEAARHRLLLGNGRDGLAALKEGARQAQDAATGSATESRAYSPTVADAVDPSLAAYKAGDPGTVGRGPEDLAQGPDPSATGAGRKETLTSDGGLFELAREEYGEAPAAYAVAYANRLDSPTAVAEGREVTLPPDAWVKTFMERVHNGNIQVDAQGHLSGDLPERPAELSRDVRAQHFGTVAM